MPKVDWIWNSSRVNIERIRDMRKTSIEKVIDRQPCTNAEAQTFCGNA